MLNDRIRLIGQLRKSPAPAGLFYFRELVRGVGCELCDDLRVLDRAVWTESDLEVMGWHDATLYALAFPVIDGRAELLLDLDYVVRWVNPASPARHFTFWVAPATLVFHDVYSLRGEIDAQGALELDDIGREGERWTIAGQNFELSFRASGFHQHFRGHPIDAGTDQSLGARRGRSSFDRPLDFPPV